MFWGKKIKTLILQGAEYKCRNSARTVKMLHFPPNSLISSSWMSSSYEETNITARILPHSTQDVCPRTAGCPACIVPTTSPGIFSISKITNRKRENYNLSRPASLPLAHLPRDLWLCKNILASTFLLSAINMAATIYSFPAAMKIIPLISQNHGKLAPLTIFFSGPIFLSHGCRHMNNLWWSMAGSPFLHAHRKLQLAISILIYPYTYLECVEEILK